MIPLATALALTISLQQPLPVLKAKYLSGREAKLPADCQGKVALLAFGFSYASRYAVEDFVNRYHKQFEKEPRVTFYEIPVIAGAAQLGKWFIDSGMRKGTPKELHENVITVYGNATPWKEYLGYKNPDDVYLVLLDPSGAVRWHFSGKFDDAAYQQLLAVTNEMLSH